MRQKLAPGVTDLELIKCIFLRVFCVLEKACGDNALRRYDRSKSKFSGPFLISAFELVALGVAANIELVESQSPQWLDQKIKEIWADPRATGIYGQGVSTARRLPKTLELEPVREHIESSESFVIQGRRPDSFGGSPMWTSKNRRRYDRSRLRYPSDVTDEEWALVEPLIPPAKRGGNRRHVVVREVINGLMYILSTGCQWRAIPKDLPPRSTLYDYFDLWSWDGTLDRIHDALYAQCREAASREASPTAAIIDSQSVKSAEKGGLRLIRRAMMQARRSRARSGTSSSIRRAC